MARANFQTTVKGICPKRSYFMMNLFHNQSISSENKSLCKVASVVYSEFTTQTIDFYTQILVAQFE